MRKKKCPLGVLPVTAALKLDKKERQKIVDRLNKNLTNQQIDKYPAQNENFMLEIR